MSTETPQPEWPPGSQYYIAPLYFKEARGNIWYYSETNNEWYLSTRTLEEIRDGKVNPALIVIVPKALVSKKLCTSCDQTKSRGEFYERAQSRDGLAPSCKQCVRDYSNKRNREKRELE